MRPKTCFLSGNGAEQPEGGQTSPSDTGLRSSARPEAAGTDIAGQAMDTQSARPVSLLCHCARASDYIVKIIRTEVGANTKPDDSDERHSTAALHLRLKQGRRGWSNAWPAPVRWALRWLSQLCSRSCRTWHAGASGALVLSETSVPTCRFR